VELNGANFVEHVKSQSGAIFATIKIKLIWQRKTSKGISNQNLVVADVLDDYAGRLAQSKDIPIRMSNEKYVDVVSSLRYAIAYLRTGGEK
jgi:hypothetical protein